MTSKPYGVIDIGSNSVRLVIYDGHRRAPRLLLNEKISCGLGRGLKQTNLLNPEAKELTLKSLQRFQSLLPAHGVKDYEIVATAALRDAGDGADFAGDIERVTGFSVNIISGSEEALLSAYGVIAGIPHAEGLVGDLGGGSLELTEVVGGRVLEGETFPLGALRLIDGTKMAKVSKFVDQQLSQSRTLHSLKSDTFYAVGGSWRALAAVHMDVTAYPLPIIQNYEVKSKNFSDFLDLVIGRKKSVQTRIKAIVPQRAEGLPYAALILRQLTHQVDLARIVFSTCGVREGALYRQLSANEQRKDPLLSGCRQLVGDAVKGGEVLIQWTSGLWPEETPENERLREAVCTLSGILFFDGYIHQSDHVFQRIIDLPLWGVTHVEKAKIALALYMACDAEKFSIEISPTLNILSKRDIAWACGLGVAVRTGLILSGNAVNLLCSLALSLTPRGLILQGPQKLKELYTPEVDEQMRHLARILGVPLIVQM